MKESEAGTRPPACETDVGSAPACRLETDAEMLAAGWERRFIAEPQRAEEMAQTYRELGFAVRLIPAKLLNIKEECEACRPLFEKFLAVYTKKDR